MLVTVFFKHKYITNPPATPADTAVAALDNATTSLQEKILTPLHESSLQSIQRLQTILDLAKAMQDANNTKAITAETQPTYFPPRQSPLLQTCVTSKGLIVTCPKVAEKPTYPLLQHHKTTSSLNMTPPTSRVEPSTSVILPLSSLLMTAPPTVQQTSPTPKVVPPRRSPRLAANLPKEETTPNI